MREWRARRTARPPTASPRRRRLSAGTICRERRRDSARRRLRSSCVHGRRVDRGMLGMPAAASDGTASVRRRAGCGATPRTALSRARPPGRREPPHSDANWGRSAPAHSAARRTCGTGVASSAAMSAVGMARVAASSAGEGARIASKDAWCRGRPGQRGEAVTVSEEREERRDAAVRLGPVSCGTRCGGRGNGGAVRQHLSRSRLAPRGVDGGTAGTVASTRFSGSLMTGGADRELVSSAIPPKRNPRASGISRSVMKPPGLRPDRA